MVITITKSNIKKLLPIILQKLDEGYLATIIFEEEAQLSPQEKKELEEFNEARKQVPAEQKFAKLQKDRKLFEKYLKDYYIEQ